MSDLIRVGVLGPGRIVRRVMKDFPLAQGVELVAVASRDLARAKEAAERYSAKYAFGSYEELARCDEVDLVYVATPHPFHCAQAIQMMESGKHVLCEKPISLNEGETRAMVECARKKGVFLMEAMWTRFFPATRKMMEVIARGDIGRVRHIYGVFSSSAQPDPESRLFNLSLGGGSLLDVGVYPLMACTHVLGWEPVKVQGTAVMTDTGVDARFAVQMEYADGATAQLMSALDASAPSHLMIYGSEGHILMEDFWHPSSFTLCRVGGERVQYEFPAENEGFRHEFEEAARRIRSGERESPIMTWEESIAVSRITEKLRREAGLLYPGEE